MSDQPALTAPASAKAIADRLQRYGVFIYEVDFEEEGKHHYVRLEDFNRVARELEAQALPEIAILWSRQVTPNWAFIAKLTDRDPVNGMRVYETLDPVVSANDVAAAETALRNLCDNISPGMPLNAKARGALKAARALLAKGGAK